MSSVMPPPRSETRAAIDNLNHLLHLWGGEDKPQQDWELLIADPRRLVEFCDLYECGFLNAETKFALMMLIISSLDDALRDGTTGFGTGVTAPIERLLRQEFVLHLHTIHYWALLDEADTDNVFPVTPLLRSIWADCFKRVPAVAPLALTA